MSWDQLAEMAKENRERRERAALEPPEECPIDGMALDVRDDGVRNCPMGNYRWSG